MFDLKVSFVLLCVLLSECYGDISYKVTNKDGEIVCTSKDTKCESFINIPCVNKTFDIGYICNSGQYNMVNYEAEFFSSNSKYFADKKMDCENGQDEVSCFSIPCSSRAKKCPDLCLDLPNNKSKCLCAKNHQLVAHNYYNKYTERCEVLHKCTMRDMFSGYCSQRTKCIFDRRECYCNDGYYLNPDNYKDCLKEKTKILYNSDKWIYIYDVESKKKRKLVPSGNINSIDYDPYYNNVYFYNIDKNEIQRAVITEKENIISVPQTIHQHVILGKNVSPSLAVDYINDNLYFLRGNSENYDLKISKLDGRYTTTVFSSKAPILQVFLNPLNDKFFFLVEKDEKYVLYFRYMSEIGKNPYYVDNFIANSNVFKEFEKSRYPVNLILDQLKKDLYFWDPKYNSFQSFNKNGEEDRNENVGNKISPICFDVESSDDGSKQKFYFISDEQKMIKSDFTSNSNETLINDLSGSTSVRVYLRYKLERTRVQKLRDFCANACKYLCLKTSEDNGVCMCPANYKIGFFHKHFDLNMKCDSEHTGPGKEPIVCDCNNATTSGSNEDPCISACRNYNNF